MAKIRVLVVDDSVVVRRIVTDVLNGDPAIEVVGAAANGKIALQKLATLKPDAVTLDVEMPEMDGLETVRQLRKSWPKLPVIMFSTLTERGASTTLEALSLGANDYVTKPANVGSVSVAMDRIREELIPKLKAFCGRTAGPSLAGAPLPIRGAALTPATPRVTSRSHRIEAVVIGVSTGGPNALATLLPQLPGDFPVPILITQHMPPVFTRLLAERLGSKSRVRVVEAQPGQILSSGGVWLAPGDHHLVVERAGATVRTGLRQTPPENSCRPAVDVMFRAAVQVYGGNLLAVVLTGMGQDGFKGCEAVRQKGGQVFVQDEHTSVVWGMPGFVARAGLADRVLPLEQLAGEITRRAMEGRTVAAAPRAAVR